MCSFALEGSSDVCGPHLKATDYIWFDVVFPDPISFQLPTTPGLNAEQADASSRSPSEIEPDAPGTVPSLASCDFIDE